ncbi:hypothetical protein FCU94_18610 [Vibrio sp. JPW-9-11-11]|uniref:hypothetical protein n=1 Tax=Vibrio sp. JPW-9-11-11 TaxID=1416532 RepID=UPI001593B333|nr:hypothetical protein [Vibrio sp. JPW-9-11-11]NVD08864.1 hypothetical protein [Vibrio sp. JPW-9-11-11]
MFVIAFRVYSQDLVIRIDQQPPITLTHQSIVEQFSATEFTTQLPWFDRSHHFSGFKVSELLDYLDIDNVSAVSFIALNDYGATTIIEDVQRYQPIVAYQMDHKNIRVRHKGPYWLVFNLDRYPSIDNATYHSQMVWQIDEILIHKSEQSE